MVKRRKFRLEVVFDAGQDPLWCVDDMPFPDGNENSDAVCGSCGATVARGYGPQGLQRLFLSYGRRRGPRGPYFIECRCKAILRFIAPLGAGDR